jgi:hypothetical protein
LFHLLPPSLPQHSPRPWPDGIGKYPNIASRQGPAPGRTLRFRPEPATSARSAWRSRFEPTPGTIPAGRKLPHAHARAKDPDVHSNAERLFLYHGARLGELVERVAEAIDGFRAGELDAFAIDDVIHQYHRAARELWKFCWLGGTGARVDFTARALRDMADQDERTD